ncbi:MAG: WbqC family protein [Bacteroidales bacterium]|nr:WbqC family protein [Bacteroidales bacterium]MDD2204096.1 WbqC family protein [Bacteroidales bacterium]MDD3152840.1 WbqC family protein [Bacteroidales bacterium]MDD3913760.1 WbqC family protein [Bacteroidales bacterium]MDD4633525.1 WbqC family protein [Bacteroidales bacterium]
MTIIPLTYFGPISWWRVLTASDDVVFDIYENYIKQTCRNRCSILSANGVLNLSVPVKKINGNHTAFRDIEIENNQRWQIIHLRAVMSAYRAAPFYDYIIDNIKFIWEKKYNFLIDVCLDSLDCVSKILNINPDYRMSDCYVQTNEHDKRNCKHFSNIDEMQHYHQVFEDRFDFVPDLSILDKLFNDYCYE